MEPPDFLGSGARSDLPLRRQVLLYLDPGALFMDASRGSPAARRRALAYNRAMRWMLLPYLRRWVFIAAACLLAVAPMQALAAAGFCVAFTITVCIGAAWLLLGARGDD